MEPRMVESSRESRAASRRSVLSTTRPRCCASYCAAPLKKGSPSTSVSPVSFVSRMPSRSENAAMAVA